LSIVRGLAYYTGFVYEAFEASGEGRALAGGGRYDNLIKKLSGNIDLPAAGFAIGDMTLSDCLEKNGLLPTYIMAPDLFLICGPDQRMSGISLVALTRKAGFAVSHPLKESGFGKQFKDAGKSGARYALILGEEEETAKQVKIKDLKSSGEMTVNQAKLIQELEKLEEEGGISAPS
jgi:histidyl-tRNA synthetase